MPPISSSADESSKHVQTMDQMLGLPACAAQMHAMVDCTQASRGARNPHTEAFLTTQIWHWKVWHWPLHWQYGSEGHA